jgi:hypothetical protein
MTSFGRVVEAWGFQIKAWKSWSLLLSAAIKPRVLRIV